MARSKFRPIPEFTAAQAASFWSRVTILGDNECWPWTGRLMVGQTRGAFSGPDGGVYPAPRIAWALYHGKDPEGLSVLHHCDNPNCCNPVKCLWAGSRGDNNRDRTKKGRTAQGESHYLHKNPELRNGELNPSSKLSTKDVLDIREAFYLLQVQLAEKYSVGVPYIKDIARLKTWKHV